MKRDGNRSFSKDERFKYHVVEEELKERSPGPTTAEHKPLLYKNVSALSILPSIRSRSSKSKMANLVDRSKIKLGHLSKSFLL